MRSDVGEIVATSVGEIVGYNVGITLIVGARIRFRSHFTSITD